MESFKILHEVPSTVFDCVLIHYGELGLKGLNRPIFEKKLIENICRAVEGLEYNGMRKRQGRIILELKENSDKNKFAESLKKVFGIAWFAFCFRTEATLEDMQLLLKDRFQLEAGTRAKISAKRADKTLPFTSMDVNRELGTYLVKQFKAKISLSEPQKEIFVELFEGKAYMFDKKFKGLYGLPIGVSGKVLHLLSGGIDSPVAAWLLMKRGCEVDFLHFHAFQQFDERRNAKILELVKVLTQFCFKTRVFFVPYYPFEAEAVEAPAKYRLILFRRFMIKVAEEIAKQHDILTLGSGENLAQVSSQTLENIAAINKITSLPILRPLLTYEKNEIVELARRIGTFEISTRPYKDCCSLFISKHPATKAKLEIVESIERKLNLSDAIKESIEKTEIINVK
ncbi:tRNA 4-thiouridine(8) synthase ThiI [Candidatus Bathyarchaeota archaeon]|nr:tRNA 4-thiouridine(8) synthase ThiI [Candidatus Bathyarchaeota archaeon]